MADPRAHKIRKGETLIWIAKKWKHRKWQDIWDAPENAALKKKRGAPEAIRPNDVLHIPYTLEEQRAIIVAKLALLAQAEAERKLASTFVSRSEAASHASDLAMQRYKQADKDFADTIDMLRDCYNAAKKVSDAADAANTAATVVVNVGKLARTSGKAAKAAGDELAELNRKALGEAFGVVAHPLEKLALKAGADYLLKEENEISEVGNAVGALGAWYDEITNPSYWAGAIARMRTGSSWSEAFAYDAKVELKSKIHAVDKDRIYLTKRLLREAQNATKAAKSMIEQGKAALRRADTCSAEVDKLPAV